MSVTFGIRGKLIAYTLAIVLLVGSGLSWFFTRELNQRLLDQFNATTELVTQETLGAVRDPLYFLNVSQVREVLKRALSNAEIQEVVVLDASGRILSDGSAENRRWLQAVTDAEAKTMIATKQPITVTQGGLVHMGRLVLAPGGDLLGYLYFEYSTESLRRAKKKVYWLSLGITAAFLALGGVLAWLLATQATRPLTLMLAAVKKIGAGDLEASLPTGRTDEIGALQEGINAMARSVHDATVYLEARVRERTEQLETLTKTDLLTQLLNRRGMAERIETEITRAKRENRSLGLLSIDADHFKSINDTHGHAAGDRALSAIAEAIRSTLRPYDSASRWGGDEFMAMFPDADEAHLRAIAARLLGAVANNRELTLDDGTVVQLRITIGGAALAHDDDFESLLHKADHALYVAKEHGRNQYLIHHG